MSKVRDRLFAGFPAVTTVQWEEKIKNDLKGKDYEKVLVWRTNEGFPVRPYYRAENLSGLDWLADVPGDFPYSRGNTAGNNWLIRQDIRVSDPLSANEKALEILGKGVSSIGFVFGSACPSEGSYLETLLKGICLESAEVNFVCSSPGCDLTRLFAEYGGSGTWDPGKVQASVSNDPLSTLMLTGKFDACCENGAFTRLKEQVMQGSRLPLFRTVAVNGHHFGNSGSSIVQELAYSLSMGTEYLSHLTESGLTVDEVASAIKFNLSISNNYFMEVAKLRAGRVLWAHIVKAFGAMNGESMKMIVHAETATYNKTVYDPYVNLLRTQTEAMSAALGGAHSITVMPFDAIFREPSAFSERIARNQQILLKEEANIDKITDAGGGSYYIENLTASIAEQSWKLFLQTEQMGGFLAALRAGFIQKQVKEMAARRDQNFALRRENLLGVNQFPAFTEVISDKLDEAVFHPRDLTTPDAEVETLKPYRAGQVFEALRYKTDQWSVNHTRPVAFMLTIGNLAMQKARAQFSCNFFAVAGFEVIDNNSFASVDEGLAAARTAGADLIVACSSDEEYAAIVPELAEKASDKIIVVAGNPACRPDLEALGVKYFIHIRSNLLRELMLFQNEIIK